MTVERKRPQLKLTVDPSTAALLEKTGNSSRYVDAVVEQRWSEWTNAIHVVDQLGWRRAEVLASCDASNGLWHLGFMKGAWFGAELEDATRLNGLVAKWELDEERWAGLIKEVCKNDELAGALWIISREFWAQNNAVDAAIDRLGREPGAQS